MRRPQLLCAATVLLALSLCAIADAQDPTCATGIVKKDVCCPASCGTCGGGGCYARSLSAGTRCCLNGIRDNEPSCASSMPPCTLGGGGGGNPTPTSSPAPAGDPRSSLTGEWKIASVTEGLPVARHEACAVMVNGLVVLVGGRGFNKAVSIFDPKTAKWENRDGPGQWEQIHHFQCVAIGSSIWIPASWKKRFPDEEVNEDVYEYRVNTDSWHTYPGMPASRNRGGAAAVRRGDWIYVVAGNQGGHGAHATSLGYVDRFNWRTKTWELETIPDVPGGGRDHVGGALVRDRLCIAGGRDGGVAGFFNATLETTYCYNFNRETWVKRANFPQPRAGSMYGKTCDGMMMIAGGEGHGQAWASVHVFDYFRWRRAPDLVDSRHGSGIAVARCSCGHLFIPSGSGVVGGSRELTTTEHYIPAAASNNCAQY